MRSLNASLARDPIKKRRFMQLRSALVQLVLEMDRTTYSIQQARLLAMLALIWGLQSRALFREVGACHQQSSGSHDACYLAAAHADAGELRAVSH